MEQIIAHAHRSSIGTIPSNEQENITPLNGPQTGGNTRVREERSPVYSENSANYENWTADSLEPQPPHPPLGVYVPSPDEGSGPIRPQPSAPPIDGS